MFLSPNDMNKNGEKGEMINLKALLQENCIDDLICKAEIETQVQRTSVWILKGNDRVGEIGRLGLTCMHFDTMYKIDNKREPNAYHSEL